MSPVKVLAIYVGAICVVWTVIAILTSSSALDVLVVPAIIAVVIPTTFVQARYDYRRRNGNGSQR